MRPVLDGPQKLSEPYHREPRVAALLTRCVAGVGVGWGVRAVHFNVLDGVQNGGELLNFLLFLKPNCLGIKLSLPQEGEFPRTNTLVTCSQVRTRSLG